jgi:Flp pilus assembly protein TadG
MLFALVFGAIEIGRGLMVQQLLSNAARDGARSAMLEGATVQDVETSVAGYLGDSSISDVTVVVTPNPLSLAQGGDPVRVLVSVPFNSVSWLQPARFLNDITLSAAVTMRREVFTSSTESSASGSEPEPTGL